MKPPELEVVQKRIKEIIEKTRKTATQSQKDDMCKLHEKHYHYLVQQAEIGKIRMHTVYVIFDIPIPEE